MRRPETQAFTIRNAATGTANHVRALVVVEADEVEGLVLDVLEAREAASVDELVLERRDRGLGHRVVVGVALRADRRVDLQLVETVAAMVLARAAYEGGIRVLWMLEPDDPFDREGRWPANVQQTARFHEKLALEFESLAFEDHVVEDRREAAAAIRAFAEGVTGKLPEGIEPTPTVPPLRAMVRELAMPERYVAYRLGSQFTHVGGYAVGIYRRNLGTAVEVGEFLEPDQWIAPLHMTWWSLWMPAARLLSLMKGDVEAFKASLPVEEIEKAVDALAASAVAGGE
jgi:hypothetical protein